jgi:hypothetical protein
MDAMEQRLRNLIQQISVAMEHAKGEDREELARLRGVVEARLDQSGDDDLGLVDSLGKAEVRFETGHPRLAQSIRQALQSLSSAGI